MSFFRNREGKEVEKPKENENKIRDPEQPKIEAKNKLNASEREGEKKKSWELSPEERKKVEDGNKEISERYKKKLNPNAGDSNAGDPNRDQRQKERGHVTDDGR